MKPLSGKSRMTMLLVTAAMVPALSGCAKIQTHQGYIIDNVLVNSIQPGVDNKQSVVQTLGRPTFTGQFSENDWYYVSRSMRQLAFGSPKPREQMVMRVRFDQAGNVARVDKTGVELAVNISPDGDKTPTRGRDRSFFEDLFGNIGTVGAPGAGAGQGR
nr:outer membrane protein assembly factor BamE [Sphingorhabdus sp. Alg239-R122]